MAIGKKTGGRRKGSLNVNSRELQREISSTGETPLAYMLRVMRDPSVDHERRDRMAVGAAKFVHPTFAAIEATGNLTLTLENLVAESYKKSPQ